LTRALPIFLALLMAPLDPRDERVDVRLRRALESGTLPPHLLVCEPAAAAGTYSHAVPGLPP
jgi:hypothetical protein